MHCWIMKGGLTSILPKRAVIPETYHLLGDMLVVILNIVFSRIRLQNLLKRHNLSLLFIITRSIYVRFIAVCFSL